MIIRGVLPIRYATLALLLTAMLATATRGQDDAQRFFSQAPTVERSQVREAPSVEPAEEPAAEPAEEPQQGPPPALKEGPPAQWIWGRRPASGDDRYFFRKEFEGGAKGLKAAWLVASCDNMMDVFLNGQRVASSSEWQSPVRVDVRKHVQPETNVLLIAARNGGGPAGLAAKLYLQPDQGEPRYVVTDESWGAAQTRDTKEWAAAVTLGKMGTGPWGNVFANAGRAGAGLPAAPRDVFNVLPGFQVELLYTVPKATQGSWVSIALDDRGRIIASDQGNQGLFRITPPPLGSDADTRVERLDARITSAQGMLHAFGSLYVSVNGGPGSGLYRLRDTDGDDAYDEVKLLKRLQGGGEHGPHSLRLSPDGKSLYVIAGNHTNPPQDFDASRVPSNWGEDLLLPRQWDARGHARGRLAPGGWIARTDPDGRRWEIVSVGYRNAFDMDFNPDGELFAYDADMEWDMGSPWYRPTRVVHATSGSEFGWRSGTGKWPTYSPDSLPPILDIGPGSPVGVTFGSGAKFPAKYQRALYLLDWTFGTMYAIHLQPQGASYTATKEEFLSRTPLPLTDAVVGRDGALYFTVGGRGTQSALYRVTYVGEQSTAPVDGRDKQFADLRALRHKLEAYHSGPQAGAVEAIWPHLGHADRHIRYAARVALEHQDVSAWQQQALEERDPQALVTAIIALARQGDKALQPKAVAALRRLDFAALSEPLQLELLRAYALVFIRLGAPEQATAADLAALFDGYYPAKSNDLNRELSRLLVYLNSPTVVGKTLALMTQPGQASAADIAALLARNPGYGGTIARMLANYPELQKMHYAFVLRNVRYGWTLDERRAYFAWLDGAVNKSGGASYEGFIKNIRSEAVANMSEAEREALASTVLRPPPKPEELPKPLGPGREWSLDVLASLTDSGLRGRSFEGGRRAFAAARCGVCHRFDGAGGATGPDLSSVAGRFSFRDLCESLVEPSKVVSDQYRASIITTLSGQAITGRVVGEEDGKLTVMTDPEDGTKIARIARDDVDRIEPSKVSLMPKGLLNVLSEDEVLDLLAYMMSRGNPRDRMFGE